MDNTPCEAMIDAQQEFDRALLRLAELEQAKRLAMVRLLEAIASAHGLVRGLALESEE